MRAANMVVPVFCAHIWFCLFVLFVCVCVCDCVCATGPYARTCTTPRRWIWQNGLVAMYNTHKESTRLRTPDLFCTTRAREVVKLFM